MTWKLLQGDCLELMRDLPTASIDAIITDPPYGIDYQSSRRIDREQRLNKIANDTTPFIWWINDAYRVLKDNSPICCFCRWDVQTAFYNALEWAGFKIRSQVIWDREVHGMGDLASAFAPQHDVIWFATKGRFKFPNKRPTSILHYPRVSPELLVHPNEKPIMLLQHLISVLTNKGQVVLDPFAGSGTTGMAAQVISRDSIMMELNPYYCEIIKRRMAGIEPNLFEGATI